MMINILDIQTLLLCIFFIAFFAWLLNTVSNFFPAFFASFVAKYKNKANYNFDYNRDYNIDHDNKLLKYLTKRLPGKKEVKRNHGKRLPFTR